MGNSCAYEFQIKHFGFSDTPPENFYVSQWFNNKAAFVAYRAFLFIYSLAWSTYSAIEYSRLTNGHLYYLYLSHWGEWTLVVSLGFLLAVSIYGLACDTTPGAEATDENQGMTCCHGNKCAEDELRWFHRLCWVVRTACLPVAYVITIVFWSFDILSRASLGVDIHRHVINSVIVTVDLFVGKIPVRFLHLIYAALYAVAYTLFTLILHWSGVRSRFYDVMMDWARIPGLSAGAVAGFTLVAVPALHAIAFGLYRMRTLIASRVYSATQAPPARAEVHGIENQGLEMEVPNGTVIAIN